MATVLVVDDEPSYCEEIEAALSRAGHLVMTAGSGREAIELGTCCRPDVIVTDWMLKDRLNGIDLMDVLRLVVPNVRCILITGYASSDVVTDAENREVIDIISKPFSLSQIRAAVGRAIDSIPPAEPEETGAPVGIVETDANFNITFGNLHFLSLIEDLGFSKTPASFHELFRPEQVRAIEQAKSNWVAVTPFGSNTGLWHVRAVDWLHHVGKFYVILSHGDEAFRSSSVVRMLVGDSPATQNWPQESHVVVFDKQRIRRRVTIEMLRKGGCTCHAAASVEEALQLIEKDKEVTFVILGEEHGAAGNEDWMRKIKAIGRNISIIEYG